MSDITAWLEKLGIRSLGHQKKLLKAITSLDRANPGTTIEEYRNLFEHPQVLTQKSNLEENRNRLSVPSSPSLFSRGPQRYSTPRGVLSPGFQIRSVAR